MATSDRLLDAGEAIWEAQFAHPFVTELAAGTLDRDAFEHWVGQDYRYLLDYARVSAIAATKASEEETMRELLALSHSTLSEEMDLHREFAAGYDISPGELERTRKAPTCVAYTNFLVRTAHEAPLPVIAAALYPCGQGYLDVADHMAELADGEHRYTPFIELYTSDEFREVVASMRDLVDRCGEAFPGERAAMREAFLTSARLEYAFWEMAYTREEWDVPGDRGFEG